MATPWMSFVTMIAAAGLAAAPPADLPERFEQRLDAIEPEIIEFRRDLHRHPELSGQEERTAGRVADRLEGLGLEVRRGVGGTGVVALLRGGPGPVAAFRADMDAVRSDAPDPVPYASETPGVRHICGHDVHTSVGVALAEGLAAVGDELPGSVLFLFQPAEETASGARAMIADGALSNPRPDAIFAFHTAPLEIGSVATARSVMMSSRDRVEVRVTGDGDPEAAATALAATINGLTTLDSPFAPQPIDSEFLAARVRAEPVDGSADWRVSGAVTLAAESASRRLGEELVRAVAEIEDRFPRVRLEVEHEKGWIAGVTNDAELAAAAVASARAELGDDRVVWLRTIVPAFSEDFGSFQRRVPGVMFFLGVSNAERGWVGMPHTPDYVADEASILVGARMMGAVILDYLVAAHPD